MQAVVLSVLESSHAQLETEAIKLLAALQE